MDHLGVALGTHEPIEDLLDFRKCQVEAHTGVRETQRTLHVAGPVDLDDSQAGVLLVGAQPTIVRTAVLEMARVRPAGSGPWLAAVLGRGSVNIEAGFSTLRQPSKLCALRLNRSHLTSLSGSPIEGRDAYALFVVLSLCLGIHRPQARGARPDHDGTHLDQHRHRRRQRNRGWGGIPVGASLHRGLRDARGCFHRRSVRLVHGQVFYPLAVALAVIAIVAATTWLLAESDPAWSTPSPSGIDAWIQSLRGGAMTDQNTQILVTNARIATLDRSAPRADAVLIEPVRARSSLAPGRVAKVHAVCQL